MTDRDYKKSPAHARILRLALASAVICGVVSGPARAGLREDEITLSVLKQVRYISKMEKKLDRFGKSTLSQSAVILDLSTSAQPVLIGALNKEKDWKVRFWVIDILGYVGDRMSVHTLMNAAVSKKERREVRERAHASLRELAGRVEANASQ